MIDFLNDVVPAGERQAIVDRVSTFNIWPLLFPLVGHTTEPAATAEHVGSIFFPMGQYWSDETWELKRIVRMSGEGCIGNKGWHTNIKFRPGIVGVQFNHRDTLADGLEDPETTQSGGSIITGMAFSSKGRDHADATINDHGIKMRNGGVLREVLIRHFGGHGLYLVGTAGSSDPALKGGPSSSTFEHMNIYTNGGSGVYVIGADANINNFYQINSIQNSGWGFEDYSFLGNRYYGCHATTNTGGAYRSDNQNSRNLYSNCYVEGNSPVHIVHPSLIVGGLGMHKNTGNAQHIGDGRLTPFDIWTELWDKDIQLRIGKNGSPLAVAVDGDSNGWAHDTLDNRGWTLETKHQGSSIATRLTTDLSATSPQPPKDENGVPLPGGEMLLRNVRYRMGAGVRHKRISDEFADILARLDALEDV
jgi:hypothetical protein